jgi:hypothetical protein
MDLARLISSKTTPKSGIITNSAPTKQSREDDFYPDLVHTQSALGVIQTRSLQQAIDKTWDWFSSAVVRKD